MTTQLGEHEGSEIVSTPLILRRTGDGLSTAMKLAPSVLHRGDTIYVVVKAEVKEVSYRTNKDDKEAVDRVHVAHAVQAVIVDEKLVAKALAAQSQAIAKAKEMEGQEQMPGMDGDD